MKFLITIEEQPQIFLFGSAAQGFRFKNGDLDICLIIKKAGGIKLVLNLTH